MNIVILKLSDDELDDLRDVIAQGEPSDFEKKIWNHCYRLSDADAHSDTVASYL